ncbi:tRNA (adenine(22)-N(1))-methyltransferase [Anaerovibrio sp.]|uniref:tRNA (adenine(22)-N(1))-methyltransferase n=1 Tax=Anaerovibrio sp. TaxID=1872532 RepID=UPI003F1512FE
MLLDDRLEAVAAFVEAGGTVADVGTDHGYLAMELKRRDESRRVIAADKNAGPCGAARRTLRENGMAQAVEVRQGDGLAALAAGEADTVCIAGMGGKLIADILAAQPEVFAGLRSAVLQPQNAFALLRSWLYEHGWHIEDEALARVDGRVYQIIRAVPGEADMPSRPELLIGPVLLKKRPALFREHVENNLEALAKVLAGMRKGSSPDRQRLQELAKDMMELEAMLK